MKEKVSFFDQDKILVDHKIVLIIDDGNLDPAHNISAHCNEAKLSEEKFHGKSKKEKFFELCNIQLQRRVRSVGEKGSPVLTKIKLLWIIQGLLDLDGCNCQKYLHQT